MGLIEKGTWDESCSNTSDAGIDDREKELQVQAALRKINEVRVTYLRDGVGLDAKLVEIPGTIMNQMIVVKK